MTPEDERRYREQLDNGERGWHWDLISPTKVLLREWAIHPGLGAPRLTGKETTMFAPVFFAKFVVGRVRKAYRRWRLPRARVVR